MASKYAGLLLSHRDIDQKENDASDFRRMIRAKYDRIARDELQQLADRNWHRASERIDRFDEIGVGVEPFRV